MIDNNQETEKAIIVSLKLQKDSTEEINESIKELTSLIDTAGAKVVESFVQNLTNVVPAFYIGTGKVQEIKEYVYLENIDTVVFDTELSPMQIRNLEKTIETKILDRSSVILDIFAKRAKTREAKTQVELAQLKYFMPRLTRQWTHLSRQVGGGVGTKGPGETQLEVDKRLIRDRIKLLENELKDIEKQRHVRNKSRKDIYNVALVGYTNAGKSTLMNRLSASDVFTEDRLFATLDSTTRTVKLENKKEFLLTDTVGFINKLPHNLVASFKSTLEEVVSADLILHVIDVTHSNFEEHISVTEAVLKDLNSLDKPTIYVFNKSEDFELGNLDYRFNKNLIEKGVFVSAKENKNINNLIGEIINKMESDYQIKEFEIPITEAKIISEIYRFSEVLSEEFKAETAIFKIKANSKNINNLNKKLNKIKS